MHTRSVALTRSIACLGLLTLAAPVLPLAADPKDIPDVPGPSGTGARGVYESLRSGESGIVRDDLPLRFEFPETKDRDPGGKEPSSIKSQIKATDLDEEQPAPKTQRVKQQRSKQSVTKTNNNTRKQLSSIDYPAKSQSVNTARSKSRKTNLPNTVANAGLTPQKRPDVVKPVASNAEYLKPDSKPEIKPQISSPNVTGLPQRLDPTPKGNYKYRTPDFYRGIYLNNAVPRKADYYTKLLDQAKTAGINTLVVDVQPTMPPIEFIKAARESGFYLVARVVVFEGGLKAFPPPMTHIANVIDTGEKAAQNGFMEVQLDYIRFADNLAQQGLTLDKRYRVISSILKMATDRIRPLGVRLGGDIFGRIAFNKDDIIGQKLEVFAEHLDTIYPMLYPSHFYGEPYRIGNPYETILDGTRNCVERVGKDARIVAYIQGFDMAVKPSGLTYVEYMRRQIQASEESGGGGFVVWNALSDYHAFFQAAAKQEARNRAGKSAAR